MTADPTVFALARRGVVRVAGPDGATLLNGLLTVDVPAPGAAAYGALLTPQGKIRFELFVFRADEETILLDTPADRVGELVKALTLFKLRAQVTLSDDSAAWVALQAFDPAAAPPGLAAPDPRAPGLGVRALAPAGAAAATTRDDAGYDLARRARGLAEQGADYGPDSVFPADVNLDLLAGVDFSKGCFIGQEVVSRMRRRGSVRKRTLTVAFEGAAPARGATLTAGGANVGEMLSSSGGAGLALVRLDRLAAAGGVDTPLEADGAAGRAALPDWFPPEARGAGSGS